MNRTARTIAAVTFATAIALAAALLLAAAAQAGTSKPHLPAWFHWGSTSDRHDHHPCILTWGGKGQRKAEICSDGYAASK